MLVPDGYLSLEALRSPIAVIDVASGQVLSVNAQWTDLTALRDGGHLDGGQRPGLTVRLWEFARDAAINELPSRKQFRDGDQDFESFALTCSDGQVLLSVYPAQVPTQSARRKLEVLVDMTDAVAPHAPDVDAMCHAAALVLAPALGEWVTIRLMDRGSGDLRRAAASSSLLDPEARDLTGQWMSHFDDRHRADPGMLDLVDAGSSGGVLLDYVQMVGQAPDPSLEGLLRQIGVSSGIMQPICDCEGRGLGLLLLGRRRPAQFDESDLQAARQVADRLGALLAPALVEREHHQAAEAMSRLLDGPVGVLEGWSAVSVGGPDGPAWTEQITRGGRLLVAAGAAPDDALGWQTISARWACRFLWSAGQLADELADDVMGSLDDRVRARLSLAITIVEPDGRCSHAVRGDAVAVRREGGRWQDNGGGQLTGKNMSVLCAVGPRPDVQRVLGQVQEATDLLGVAEGPSVAQTVCAVCATR